MEVLSVLHTPSRCLFTAAIEVDGALIQCYIQDEVLETRAAEYQIDPIETDLLMDVVLYEPYIDWKPGEIPDLWTAPSIDAARERHLSRVMEAKARKRPNGPNSWRSQAERANRLKDAGIPDEWLAGINSDDALNPIRELHVMEHEALMEKARLVADQRSRMRMARVPEMESPRLPASPADRAELIRSVRMAGGILK